MDVRVSNDIGPGLRLKLPSNPKEFQTILSREESLRNGQNMKDHRKEGECEQSPSMGHRDPPWCEALED
jgi:hypothetical protein